MSDDGRKTVGVLGGMGPDATVDFMAKVIAMTDSGTDQDHVHMLVDQNPTVPDRQAAIRDGLTDVSDALGEMARGLEDAGADFLVLVCNTAHVFLDGLHARTRIPFVSIIEESVSAIDDLDLTRTVRVCGVAGRRHSSASSGLLKLLRAADWTTPTPH